MHVRKRMRRVDGQRGQDGVDLGVEIVVEIRGLSGRQLLGRAHANAVFDQEGTDLGEPHLIHAGDEVVRAARDFDQLGQRPQAVGGRVLRLEVFVKLGLEPGDADLEKLVEVRCADRQKPQPVEQRVGRVAGLFEHALVEIQPAQLAIDEPAWVGSRRRWSRRRHGRDRLTIDLSRGHDHALRRGLTPATGLAPPGNRQ